LPGWTAWDPKAGAAPGRTRKLTLMTQPITLTELRPAEFRRAIGRLVAVYAAAMNPPQRMLAGRDSILERHAANPGSAR